MLHIILYLFCLILSPSLVGRERKHATRPSKSASQKELHTLAWKHPDTPITMTMPHVGIQMGVVETPGVPPLGYTLDGDIKVFRITAQPVEQTLTDGEPTHYTVLHAMKTILGIKNTNIKQKLKAWGYNGSSPGPTIELTAGDKVRIIFKNELPEPTCMHWHGLEHPPELDRSCERNQVKPGDTHIYDFTAYQEGTSMYHSGCSISKQNRSGLMGMMIIHPERYDEPVDRHIAIILQEWALSPNSERPNTLAHQFNWFTFNGHAAPSIPIITLHQGERVRMHFGSMGINSYPLHIHGYTWTVVGTEGGPIQKSAQLKGATVNLEPCTTRTIEFTAWNHGSWPFYSLNRHHLMGTNTEVPLAVTPHGSMFTLMEVLPADETT